MLAAPFQAAVDAIGKIVGSFLGIFRTALRVGADLVSRFTGFIGRAFDEVEDIVGEKTDPSVLIPASVRSGFADAAADIEFKFPFGFKELEGIHSRTDFDLGSHEEYSGKKLQYFDQEENKSYVPYVLETSIGLDRMFLAVFSHSLQEEELENGTTRTVLRIPAVLAPNKVAVLPLLKRDGLPEIAKKLVDDLKWDFRVDYDEKDAVGRRYRRQDAAGTPFCVTIDHQTLEDDTVTIRHRDTMEQNRVKLSEVKDIIHKEVDMRYWLQKL